MNPPDRTASRLPVRLVREMPFRSQLGCTASLALILFAVATIALIAGREPGRDSWVATVVGGAFALFGLLLLGSLIRQWAASGIPETIVECSTQPLPPGGLSHFSFTQQGPANLRSLQAKLVCIEETRVLLPNAGAGRSRHRTDVRTLATYDLIAARHLRVPERDVWVGEREFFVPADARATGTDGEVEVRWRIEVWGQARGIAGFMHPFPVDVGSGPRW